jgi:branched-chain amino acid transport system permease protein
MEFHYATILNPILHGLIMGMVLVIVAGGLTVIFGMLDVLNFAHGSLYMLGGYFGYTLAMWTGNIWLALLCAPLIVGCFGFLIEYFTLRPLYGRPPVHHLLLTFGISLIIQNIIKFVWGSDIYSITLPPALSGATQFWGISYPTYSLLVLFISIGMAAVSSDQQNALWGRSEGRYRGHRNP